MAKFSAIIFLYIRYLTFVNLCANTIYENVPNTFTSSRHTKSNELAQSQPL